MPCRHLTLYRGGCPEELPTTDLLAANHGLGFTSWADACTCSPPTLTGVAGASNDVPAAKVAPSIAPQSTISPPGGNAFG
jgi:hypothetical protein